MTEILTLTSTQLSVLRGGKLHPSNAAVLKLLAVWANSASKVPCQWIVIERNGSYRLIRASIIDDLGSSMGIISALFTFWCSEGLRANSAEFASYTTFGTPRVDQGRM